MDRKLEGYGYIRERHTDSGVSYQVAAYEGKTLDGKNKYKYATVKTYEDAKKKLEEMAAKIMLNKKLPSGGKISLEHFINDEFLELYTIKNKESTKRAYKHHARYVCSSPVAKKSLQSIETAHLQAFFNSLYTKSPLSTRPLSGRTVQDVRRFVHLVFQQAIACGYVDKNPCSGTRLRREEASVRDRDEEVYSEAEIKELLEAAKGTDMECLILLFLEVGLRRGEAIALRYSDFDPTTGVINVRRNAVVGVGDKTVITDPKTMSSKRSVVLSKYCQQKLLESQRAYKKLRFKLGEDFVDSDCILHNRDGSMMHPHSLTNKWKAFQKKHGLRRIKLHGLRKTSATNMIMQGMDVKSVANRLGHKNCDITLKIYTAVTNEMKEKNAEKMDEFFEKMANG